MALTTRRIGGVDVLALEGGLLLGQGEKDLFDAHSGLLDGGSRCLVVDLTGLRSIDSSGVGSLVVVAKRSAERGAKVKLAVRPEGAVRRVLEVTCLDRAFEIYTDPESAARSFA